MGIFDVFRYILELYIFALLLLKTEKALPTLPSKLKKRVMQ